MVTKMVKPVTNLIVVTNIFRLQHPSSTSTMLNRAYHHISTATGHTLHVQTSYLELTVNNMTVNRFSNLLHRQFFGFFTNLINL